MCKKSILFWVGIASFCILQSPFRVCAQRDILSPAVFSSARIEGVIGQKMSSCVEKGVMSKNYDLYTITFKDKLDNGGGFHGGVSGSAPHSKPAKL